MGSQINLKCSVCQKEFLIYPSNLKQTNSNPACSIECRGKVKRTRKKASFEEREVKFWAKVDKTPGHGPNGDCWVWTGLSNLQGYGSSFEFKGIYKYKGAHRVSWALHNGVIEPDYLLVCHKCDNRKCVNPEHLFLGTHADNTKDMCNKGRQARGSKTKRSKLDEETLFYIRFIHTYRISTRRQLAEVLGVSKNLISMCKTGIGWKHVTENFIEPYTIRPIKDPLNPGMYYVYCNEDWVLGC